MLTALVAFAIPCLLIVLLPGPDSLVVLRGLVRGGARGGASTALGVLCGVVVWVVAAALGLSALLHASEIGYQVLKIVGAAYLVWVGLHSLRSLRSDVSELTRDPTEGLRSGRLHSGFVAGFLTDVLNPKVGVTFVTFLPGFVPDGASVGWTSFALGMQFAVFSAIYFAVLIVLSGLITTWMKTPRIRRRMDAVTGLVLVGFGIRLATEA